MAQNVLDGLNQRQVEAVTATEGYVRIIAGAGSGKTKALTNRYAYLALAAGIPTGNILCVTFTNKAAGEMKKRVRSLIGDGYDSSLITTYHGFCVRVLREHIGRLFYPESFSILDTGDQKTILEEIYTELELKLDHASFERIISVIDKRKSDTAYVDAMISRETEAFGQPADLDERIVQEYLKRQKKVFGLDFNDLINFVFVLFERFPDVKRVWQEKLEYIQVDEFQDSSSRELKLINILSEYRKNLFVVGDPDQNIYEWRGARVEILVDFDRSHPNTQTIIMDQNYRSTGRILTAANTLIDHNLNRIKKSLFTRGDNGEEIVHLHTKSENDECKWITERIGQLRGTGTPLSGIAILYRASFLSRSIEQALMNADIPYEIVGSTRFFKRMEICDALAYMRLVQTDDDSALTRIINTPRRSFGRQKLAVLKQLAADNRLSMYETLKRNLDMPAFSRSGASDFVAVVEKLRSVRDEVQIAELMDMTLVESGYEKYIREVGSMDRLENLGELKKIAIEQQRSWGENYPLSEFLTQVSLMSDSDTEIETDRVKLMTIHAAKGLEFPIVFVIGMTDGIFPSSRTLEERGQAGLEEERRLCFVAITRAMKQLYLTDSEGTGQTGSGSSYKKLPSRFLFDIGEQNYRRVGEISKELLNEARAKPSVMSDKPTLKSVGDRVRHSVFGDGVIEGVDEQKGIYSIKFDKGFVKPISASYDFDAWRDIIDSLNAKREAVKAERVKPEEAPVPIPEPIIEPEPEPVELPATAEIPQTAPVKAEIPQTAPPESAVQLSLFDSTPEEPALSDSPPDEPALSDEAFDVDYIGDNLWKRADVPHSGWVCVGMTDLGEPSSVCGMCGKQIIRYVHHMRHEHYPREIGAGRVCAGRMEGNPDAALERESAFKHDASREKRRESFVNHPRKRSKNGNEYFKYHGEIFTIISDKFRKGQYKVVYNNSYIGPYPTIDEALSAAFDVIDDKKQ